MKSVKRIVLLLLVQFSYSTIKDMYASASLAPSMGSGQKINILDLHNGPIRDIVADPNGDYIVSIGDDKRLIITDIANLGTPYPFPKLAL